MATGSDISPRAELPGEVGDVPVIDQCGGQGRDRLSVCELAVLCEQCSSANMESEAFEVEGCEEQNWERVFLVMLELYGLARSVAGVRAPCWVVTGAPRPHSSAPHRETSCSGSCRGIFGAPPVETQCLEDRSSWAWFGAGPAMSSNLMHEWERCKDLSSRVGIGQQSH